MPDREKIINGLKCMTDIDPHRLNEDCRKAGCAYVGTDCELRLMEDALVLLKEQEPAKPKPTGIEPNYNCGACGLPITQGYPFCPWCGRKVKWSD